MFPKAALNKIRRVRALTLAELMIATFIMLLSICGVLLLFINCIFMNSGSRNVTIATSHAQYVLEDIRNTPFANIYADITGGVWDWTVSTISAKGLTPLDNEVIDTSSTGASPLDVTVTITWDDEGLRSRSLTVQTLMANY